MSLSLAIALIVLLDAALIGLLVFVMSRASRLTPHATPATQTLIAHAQAPKAPADRTHSAHPRSAGHLGAPALS
jgi:hypothetical protein